MKISSARIWFLFFFLILITGCSSGGGGGGGGQVQQGDTQGKILDMISASTAPDSDGDYLPDDVEAYLGTNPNDRDTDHDGIPDFVEIFGTGFVNEAALIPDANKDGKIAAVDPDDNGDGINDGQQLDSDGDGISDYLEYYGFTYNWMSGKFAAWDGDHSKVYYKTDPHQKSTDQDPYDDNVEVTGVNMDVSVSDPGNLPMVPAYPDIIVRLEGYSVTLNQQLTLTEGSSLAQGTTWQRTTGSSSSSTTERNWGISNSTKFSFNPFSLVETTFQVNYGEKYGSTSGTSYQESTTGSILTTENWSRASSENPTDAARIKLFLKVYNKGTAVASAVIPTLTLKIGGHNVATFERGNSQINLLEPGGVYPSAPGVYWVVDSVDTGAATAPLSLTLGELKALESGAPVSITVTQMAANVMLRNPRTGVYENAGDWNEYMARIKAVSANLFFEKGDGNTVRALVYADDGVTSPMVTLGDAVIWAAKGRQDPVTNEIFITYYDEASKSYRETSLADWHFAVDGDTYKANGFSDGNPMPADFNIASLRLNPRSFVVAKAPRNQAAEAGNGPTIQVAYYDPVVNAVTAVASDYNGIKTVEFVDKSGAARPMQEDVPGSSFYVYAPGQDIANYPNGYEFSGAELVRVTNVNEESTTTLFVAVYKPPVPEPPRIVSVSVDYQLHKLYAHVESSLTLDAAPAFVRVYGDVFTTGLGYGDGFCEMKRVSNWYEDPTGWVCDLNVNWTGFTQIQGATVVAYAGPDLYTSREVTAADEFLHVTGKGTMTIMLDYYIMFPFFGRELFDTIDLDTGALSYYLSGGSGFLDSNLKVNDLAGYQAYDAWLRNIGNALYVDFGVTSRYLGKQGGPGVDFKTITRGDIQGVGLLPALSSQLVWLGDDNVFVYRTNDGRYGKLRIKCWAWWTGRYTYRGITFYNARVGTVDYEFVTFNNAP